MKFYHSQPSVFKKHVKANDYKNEKWVDQFQLSSWIPEKEIAFRRIISSIDYNSRVHPQV